MAIGKQAGTVAALVTFCLWAKREGFLVGEMRGFSTVHKVHAKNSWHYDREGSYGKAADINDARGGSKEHGTLSNAAAVARSLGLGVIFAQYGTDGPAKEHQTHLHVDVGDYANLGRGKLDVPDGGDHITANLQRAVHVKEDQVWGPETSRRLETVRAYTALYHHGLPNGAAGLQKILGVVVDGKIGPKTRAAHDDVVKAIQHGLGVKVDGIWGPGTDKAYRGVRSVRKR